MKIGRVFPNFQTDLKYTEHYLARELSSDGHQTVFITSDKYLSSWKRYLTTIEKSGIYQYDDYKVVRLKSFSFFEKVIFRNPFRLYRLLCHSGFDILHLSTLGTFSTMMVLWLIFLKGKSAPPVIISDHTDTRSHSREGLYAKVYYLFFKWQLRLLKNRIKRVITFSDVGIDILSKRFGISKKKFTVIPLGYDQNTYLCEPSEKNKDKKFVVGYAGKITREKRVDLLMEKLNKPGLADKVKLIIVGMTDSPYCHKLREIGERVSYEVEFRAFMNPEKLAQFYNFIDLAVFPGGISITTIEASGCGTPIILYKSIANLDNRVENGRGKLFETEEELGSLLEYYYDQYKNNLIDNKRIAEVTMLSSSWRKIKNKYLNIYENVRK